MGGASKFPSEPATIDSLEKLPSQVSFQPLPSTVLRLSEMLPQTVFGPAELPSVGSANHFYGTCKPCAHAHKGKCINGVQCKFCHLCSSGELKRRQKNKKAYLKRLAINDK